MNNYLYVILFFIIIFENDCFNNSSIQINNCKLQIEEGLELDNLVDNLKNTEWVYTNSFTPDSCFELKNFIGLDISEKIRWETIDSNLKNLLIEEKYHRDSIDILSGLKAQVLIGEEVFSTLPISLYTGKIDTIVPFLKIIHHSLERFAVPNKLYYYIVYSTSDSLIIEDEKAYKIQGFENITLKHLYKKNDVIRTK